MLCFIYKTLPNIDLTPPPPPPPPRSSAGVNIPWGIGLYIVNIKRRKYLQIFADKCFECQLLGFPIKNFMSAVLKKLLTTLSQYFDSKIKTLQAFRFVIRLVADNISSNIFKMN